METNYAHSCEGIQEGGGGCKCFDMGVTTTSHPQEEKEWAEIDRIVRAYYGYRDIINNEETTIQASIDELKEVLRTEKHLSYQAGLKFAMGKAEAQILALRGTSTHGICCTCSGCRNDSDYCTCPEIKALSDLTQSLTSELDKEVI